MPTLCCQVPAATAALDYDFMTNIVMKPYARGSTARKVTHIGIVGSAAAGDTRVVLKYGSDIIGYFFLTATSLAMDQLHDIQPVVDSRWCAPDAPISLVVDDAAATNPVMIMMYMIEAKKRSGR